MVTRRSPRGRCASLHRNPLPRCPLPPAGSSRVSCSAGATSPGNAHASQSSCARTFPATAMAIASAGAATRAKRASVPVRPASPIAGPASWDARPTSETTPSIVAVVIRVATKGGTAPPRPVRRASARVLTALFIVPRGVSPKTRRIVVLVCTRARPAIASREYASVRRDSRSAANQAARTAPIHRTILCIAASLVTRARTALPTASMLASKGPASKRAPTASAGPSSAGVAAPARACTSTPTR